jgi:purine-binding chemotaxis protein CheW
MMDIAEIRKKARTRAGTPPGDVPAAPSAAVPSGGVPPGPPPESAAVPRPAVAESQGLAVSSAGLDRLFAGVGGQFATEEAYQTALASQDLQEDAGFSQFLAFQLGPEEYALDITRISEIIKPREYTDIPRVPDFILGLISLRGVVVPVFDLRRRFKLGETRIDAASRVVVCKEDDVTVGLLVDSIKQVIRLAADRIEPPPAVLTGIDRNLVSGVGRFQGRMIILLNLASVLDAELA